MSPVARTVLWLVIGALCVAAFAAIVAILSGDFSDGDLKVIGTSVLFAVAASTGGAGESLRQRGTEVGAPLGGLVLVASAVTFALVTYGMWAEVDGEGFWRLAGALAIIAVDGSHACFVLARQRRDDPPGATLAMTVAVLAAAVSGTIGLLAVTAVVDDGPWELLAVVLVVQLLATAIAPILRRLNRGQAAPPPNAMGRPPQTDLAGELRDIADAVEAVASPAAARDQAERLRRLARDPALRRL